jgi:hypothetical protein
MTSTAYKLGYEESLLDVWVKLPQQNVFAVRSQRNGAKSFAGKVAEALFRFSQCDRTGCIELVPGVTAAIHNDVGFHGTLH